MRLSPRDGADELFELARDELRRDDDLDPERVDQALEVWIREALDGRLDAFDVADDEVEILWLLERELERLRDVVSALRAAVRRAMTNNVVRAGSVRLGEAAYYVGENRKRKIIDVDALVGFVDHYGGRLDDVFRLNESNLRVGALRALFDRAVEVADLETEDERRRYRRALEETFLEYVDAGDVGVLELKSIPVGERQWAKRLEHRGRRL